MRPGFAHWRLLTGLVIGMVFGIFVLTQWLPLLPAVAQAPFAQAVRIMDGAHVQLARVNHTGQLAVDATVTVTTDNVNVFHQSTIRHISSATHVVGTVTARQGFAVADIACHETTAIHQTASTQVVHGTGGFRIGVCGIVFISAHAQGIAIKEGLGTICATGQQPLLGSIREDNSMVTAASGGLSSIASSPWLVTRGVANNICVMQTGTGTVSGVITWRPVP